MSDTTNEPLNNAPSNVICDYIINELSLNNLNIDARIQDVMSLSDDKSSSILFITTAKHKIIVSVSDESYHIYNHSMNSRNIFESYCNYTIETDHVNSRMVGQPSLSGSLSNPNALTDIMKYLISVLPHEVGEFYRYTHTARPK